MSGSPPADRASLLTPPGRGAVAVIAASGSAAITAVNAHFRAANRLRFSEQPINYIAFGHWVDVDHREEVIACRTADEELEIHCHGGIAAAERILAAFSSAGSRIEPWTEWQASHAVDPLVAEADAALAAAPTRRTAAILLDQRWGALRQEIEDLQAELATYSADGLAAAKQRIAALLERAALGQHLTRPWHVALAGRPNVGKSSLINALVGYQRAIVFDQPGTTRDVLAAETAIDGWPVRLTDAAGLRLPGDELEAAGVELAKQALDQADLIIWVLDASVLTSADRSDPIAAARRELAAELSDVSTRAAHYVEPLVVINKSDLAKTQLPAGIVATCAHTGAGLPDLLAAIAQRLAPHPPAAGSAVPFTPRQMAWLQAANEPLKRGDAVGASDALTSFLRGDTGGTISGRHDPMSDRSAS